MTGTEWIVDATGCRVEALASGAQLQALCAAIIADLNLHVVGAPQWHQFPAPGGWTGMYLLTESHLTLHTFPEHQLLTLNLYCCRARKAWDWQTQLARRLGAQEVRLRAVERGAVPLALTGGTR